MKAIRLTLLALMTLLVIGLGSCRKDANPSPATGIRRDSLSIGSLALRHWRCQDPKKTIDYGLVAYYPFSGNADDWSGNGYNGTVTGAALTVGKTGHKNSAYSFNGTTDLIELPFSMGDSVSQFSVYVRVKGASIGTLWSSGDSYKNTYWTFSIDSNQVRYIGQKQYQFPGIYHAFFIGADVSGNANLSSADKWNDIVANFNNGVLQIYVNGTLISLSTYLYDTGTGIGPTQIPAPRLNGINIGAEYNSFYSAVMGESPFISHFAGIIDEMRFYNRLLTPAEIDYLRKH